MGAYLSEPVTRKESTEEEDESFKYGSSAMQGWRTGMEDAHTTLLSLDPERQLAFFGVFDGHGGREVAHYCAKNLHIAFKTSPYYAQGDLETALIRSFLDMDVQIQTKDGRRELAGYADSSAHDSDDGGEGTRTYNDRNAGCTSVVAVISGGTVVCANAGDSRCVLCRLGKAQDLSIDHKPMLEGERARILKAGGFVSDGRVNGSLALSRAIGDLEFKRSSDLGPEDQVVTALPEIQKWVLTPEDEFIILACDGIWDVLTSQACVDFVRERILQGEALMSICEALCDRCMASNTRGSGIGCDNMSVVIVQIKGATSLK